MRLVAVTSSLFDGMYSQMLEAFEAFDADYLPKEQLAEDIRDRKRQCWAVVDDGVRGVMLTQITEHGACEMTHAWGVKSWKGPKECKAVFGWLFNHLEQWAKAQGCTRFVAFAHPNWEWLTDTLGYETKHILAEKELV